MQFTDKRIYESALPVAAALVSCVIFFLRRTDIILNPSFWAEDGVIWFRQAYEFGASSLLWPQNGYYQTISKLTALITMMFPMEHAPLIYNIIGIALRGAVIGFLLTSRMPAFPLIGRMILAAYILLMPGLSEVHANITNTHWYLSIWLFMVAISDLPKSRLWLAHDILVIIIAGLSGPFILFITPVLFIRFFYDKNFRKSLRTPVGLSIVSSFLMISVIQFLAIVISSSHDRSSAPLGFSFLLLADILSSRIFIGFMLPIEKIAKISRYDFMNAAVAIGVIIAVLWLFFKSDWRTKAIIISPALMLAAGLAKPMQSLTDAQWPLLLLGGYRYFVVPNIAWFAILLLFFKKIPSEIFSLKKEYYLSVFFVAVFAMVLTKFAIEPLPDTNWKAQVAMFRETPIGTKADFPINPPGWVMHLVKR